MTDIEITRLRSRVAELEGAATKAAEIIKRNQNHQWEKITDAYAILRAVILSQSTENGNG